MVCLLNKISKDSVMLLVLKARLHEADSIDIRIPLRDSDPLGSMYDFLLVTT